MTGFVTSDFSHRRLVANNSHTLKPLIYKITGVWGNHEGSMLLWVLVLSLYAGAVAPCKRGGERLTSAALGVQGLLAAAFLLFILFTSNPFLRLDPAPFEGAGLNPLLQDPGLAVHPPMLYAGYVGLSASFSYAAAALIVGEGRLGARGAALHADRLDRAYLRHRAGKLVGLLRIGLGRLLVLGSGGECLTDAMAGRDRLAAFGPGDGEKRRVPHLDFAARHRRLFLSLIGTFLVRSGVLSSVHAFATDPNRGFFIMVLILCAIGGALGLVRLARAEAAGGRIFRHGEPRKRAADQQCVSGGELRRSIRRHALSPGAGRADRQQKISVGPPYYALTFAPIFFALLLLVPFGPRLGWRRGDLKASARTAGAGVGLWRASPHSRFWRSPARAPHRHAGVRRGGLADRRLHSRFRASARARAPAPLPRLWPMPGLASP